MKTQPRQLHGGEKIAVDRAGVDAGAEGREQRGGKGGMAEDDPPAVVPFLGKKRLPDLAEIGDILPGQGLLREKASMHEDNKRRL